MANTAISALFDGAQGSRQYFKERSCIHCGELFSREGRELRKYCSDACRAERKRLLRKGEVQRQCAWCGDSLNGAPSAQKFCCEVCRTESASRYRKDRRGEEGVALRAASLAWVVEFKKENPEEHHRRAREWWRRHKDRLNASRRTPEYRAKKAAGMRERSAKNPALRVHSRMASAIYQAIASNKSGRKWESIVGYTLHDLCRHLERQFQHGMSWNNIGKWHIDHIIPKSTFKYETDEDPEFKACWALSNLRPLWAEDNQSKGAKILTLV